jgi:hypothetical protein
MKKHKQIFNISELSFGIAKYHKVHDSFVHESGKALTATERKEIIDRAQSGVDFLRKIYSDADGL